MMYHKLASVVASILEEENDLFGVCNYESLRFC